MLYPGRAPSLPPAEEANCFDTIVSALKYSDALKAEKVVIHLGGFHLSEANPKMVIQALEARQRVAVVGAVHRSSTAFGPTLPSVPHSNDDEEGEALEAQMVAKAKLVPLFPNSNFPVGEETVVQAVNHLRSAYLVERLL